MQWAPVVNQLFFQLINHGIIIIFLIRFHTIFLITFIKHCTTISASSLCSDYSPHNYQLCAPLIFFKEFGNHIIVVYTAVDYLLSQAINSLIALKLTVTKYNAVQLLDTLCTT